MSGLEEQLIELNEDHSVVLLGSKCCIWREIRNPLPNQPHYVPLSPQDFHAYLANRTVEIPTKNGTKLVPISKEWMSWPGRRQYQGIVFDPAGRHDPSRYYNLYRGFQIKPVKGDCSKLLALILNVACKGNRKHYKYLMCWMARIIQDPGGKRPGVAVVFKGKQGTGKGTIINALGRILGIHCLHITNGVQVTGKFNFHLSHAILVFMDEATWGGNKEAEGVLKGLITEDTIHIEPKGKDCFTVDNHVNLMIASNNNWVIPAGMAERRYFVLEVSDSHMQDTAYFAAIAAELENGGLEAFMYHLLHEVDISEVDLRCPPRTEDLFDQQLRTMRTIEKWWYQLLCDGSFPRVEIDDHDSLRVMPGTSGEWPDWYSTEDLHFAYQAYARTINDRYLLDRQAFTRDLRSLCSGLKIKRRLQGAHRVSGLIVSELAACRAEFEDLVQMPISWPDSDEVPDYRPRSYETELSDLPFPSEPDSTQRFIL